MNKVESITILNYIILISAIFDQFTLIISVTYDSQSDKLTHRKCIPCQYSVRFFFVRFSMRHITGMRSGNARNFFSLCLSLNNGRTWGPDSERTPRWQKFGKVVGKSCDRTCREFVIILITKRTFFETGALEGLHKRNPVSFQGLKEKFGKFRRRPRGKYCSSASFDRVRDQSKRKKKEQEVK